MIFWAGQKKVAPVFCEFLTKYGGYPVFCSYDLTIGCCAVNVNVNVLFPQAQKAQ